MATNANLSKLCNVENTFGLFFFQYTLYRKHEISPAGWDIHVQFDQTLDNGFTPGIIRVTWGQKENSKSNKM